MNFGWSQIETTVASKLAAFKKYKLRIVAVTVFLVIFSPVIVVTYLSNREQVLYVDNPHWALTFEPKPMNYPPVEVVLESIDFVEGTAHLRADVRMNKSEPLLALAPLWTEHRDPVPVEVLFGPLVIHDELFRTFLTFGPIDLGPMGTPLHGDWSGGRPSDFSESAPTTQADVSIDGNSWWYPFDEYVIAAQVDCVVVATPDRKQYFGIPSDEYSFASKLPNFIVRNATAKDIEYWTKQYWPDIKDLKKIITKYYPTDFGRDGSIRLILTRPLFPRFFAGFFGIVALAWIAVVATVSDPKQLSLNVFGYFLALWAIRAALAAGAPTSPLFIDYATLGLYALLIAVVAARFIWIRKTVTTDRSP